MVPQITKKSFPFLSDSQPGAELKGILPILIQLLRAELILKYQIHLGKGVDECIRIGSHQSKYASFTALLQLNLAQRKIGDGFVFFTQDQLPFLGSSRQDVIRFLPGLSFTEKAEIVQHAFGDDRS